MLPKSISLQVVPPPLTMMFSGFKSQWISWASLRVTRPSSIYLVYSLTLSKGRPYYVVDTISNRDFSSISKTMHKYPLNTKYSCIWMRCYFSKSSLFGSSINLCNILISTRLWIVYSYLFFIIFIACTVLVDKFIHLTTWPKVPCPKYWTILY